MRTEPTIDLKCAICDVALKVTDRMWFFKSIVTCSEGCARSYSEKVMN